MCTSHIMSALILLSVLASVHAGEPEKGRGSLHLRITERGAAGKVVLAPCRIHLAGDQGKPVLPPGLPAFRDHFNCDGDVRLDLPAGTYTYTVERGPEYRRAFRPRGRRCGRGPGARGRARPHDRPGSPGLVFGRDSHSPAAR